MSGSGILADATAIVLDAAGRDPWLPGLRIAGIGWATVELERAAAELDEVFRRAACQAPRWAPGPRDDLLGATAWVSLEPWREHERERAPAVVLLEPDTEGRLAATLARFGEGVGAVYLRRSTEPSATVIDPARLGRPATGPLGPGRLVLARPAWGPNVVVLDR
ncbi:MAG TPA: hypothetical protein VNL94_00510 [Candidatus Binatia bacterium]|nr:hypothetical protein [Candidatus Binatia bacterium]